MSEDDDLLKQAEQALSEIDRQQGLSDEHADVLAALRIRIYGAPKKTLDDALRAAGDLKGKKVAFDEVPEQPKKPSLDEALKQPPKKTEWPEE